MKKLPKPFDIWRVKKAYQVNITPICVVLLQELERYNRLIQRMEHTLNQLRKALAGEIGMDAVLDNVAHALFNGQLPDDWRKLAPATCKQLGDWIEHLLVSIAFPSPKVSPVLTTTMPTDTSNPSAEGYAACTRPRVVA
uniref:Dynein heavy chain C-terminal domain-containing protein n=1 Tax=Anopheles maculatus TaxID=74869 RepID=A0A182SKW4_9DIPT